RGRDAAEELPRPRDGADHARALAIGEDRRVTRRPVHGGYAVQGVAAREQLEIARTQREAADQVVTASGQHSADVVEVLRSRRPDVRAVFEHATGLRLPGDHA